MKKEWLLSFVFTFFTVFVVFSQVRYQHDQQWYVWDQMGKNQNTYISLNPSNHINISEVTPASIGITRNDIFIIFKDGQFYSNRWSERINPIPFEKTLSSTFRGNSLNIFSSRENPIVHLYWSNPYDVDDPVENLSVSNNTGNTSETYRITSRKVEKIFAHQDIVAGKDIVIAIPQGDIKYIKYNQVNEGEHHILELNEMINNTNELFPRIINNVDNLLEIQTPSVPSYFIFRANETIDPKLINQFHSWIFYDSERNAIDTLKEQIRMAHDPNYVHLTSVCKVGRDYYAFYDVHFLNEGNSPAERVSLIFETNDYFELRRKPYFVSLGGEFHEPYKCENLLVVEPQRRSLLNRNIRFKVELKKDAANLLGDVRALNEIQSGRLHHNESKGYFRFCVKLKKPSRNRSYEEMAPEELRLIDPIVFFNDTPEPITEFKPSGRNSKVNRIKIDDRCPNRSCDGLTNLLNQ